MVEIRGYQRKTILKGLERDGCLLIANDMGTGKTFCAIAIARMLHVNRVLVVAPLSVASGDESVWKTQLQEYWPGVEVYDCTEGSIPSRAGVVEALPTDTPTVALVGYESYWREPLRTAIRKWAPELCIMDEAHRIKNRGSKQARFSHLLPTFIPHRLALTATPMTRGPEDLFSLFRFIDPRVYGTRWQDFQWEYLIMGGFGGHQVTGYRNRDKLEGLLHNWSTRVTKEEALDLPDEVPVEVPVRMSEEAWKYYREMRDQAITEVESLEGEQGLAVSRIVLDNILRLKQITSGFVRTDTGKILDIDTSRLDALDDLLVDAVPAAKRVVVFCHFTHDVERVAEMARKHAPVWTLSGATPKSQRPAVVREWSQSESGIIVCQISVSSLGIDLTAAHVAVYYSFDYSLINWVQCHGRLHRHGQTNKVTNYYFSVRGTVDQKVETALRNKEDLTKSVLDRSSARQLLL